MLVATYNTIFGVAVFVCLITPQTVALNCIKVDDCSCKFDDLEGAVISLRPLISHTSGPPLFQDQIGDDKNYYSYNPCYPFTEGNCTDSAICQKESINGTAISLGDQRNVTFGFLNNDVILTYFSGGPLPFQSEVAFECVDNMSPPVFVAYGSQGSPGKFEFRVRSMCACKNACIRSTLSSSIGPGSIILIVFFSAVILYLVLGSIHGKLVKKAQGLEVLPNYEFWVGLPSTLKSGSLYIVRCVCCTPPSKKYDEL